MRIEQKFQGRPKRENRTMNLKQIRPYRTENSRREKEGEKGV